jgi:RNA polymerase sigma factor (sigma-70 family)
MSAPLIQPTTAPPDEAYRRCMEPMLEKARCWFPTLRGFERDLYQTAWASLLGSSRPITNVEKYLESAVYSAGLKELRRRRRRPTVPLSVALLDKTEDGNPRPSIEALIDRTAPLPDEEVEAREAARLLSELLDELTPLQQSVIKLRWGCELPRREAAALLGITERALKREVKKAQPVLAAKAEIAQQGRWCEVKGSLVVAYRLGLLGPRRAAKAREHLESCAGCRATARALGTRLEGLAALLPVPALPAEASHGLIARAAEAADSARGTVGDLATGAKAQALGLFARAPAADGAAGQVAAAGGLRGGGSMIATLTACVIAGGGATYCAIEGIPDPVRGLTPIQRSNDPSQKKEQQADKEETVPAAGEAPPEIRQEPVDHQPSETPADPSPQDEVDTALPSPAPPGSAEFGKASTASAPPQPARAPASGGGEFTP